MTSLQLTSKQATAKKVNAEIKIKTFCEFNNPADALQVLAEFNALEDQDGLSISRWVRSVRLDTAASFCGAPVEITLGGFFHDGETQEEANAFVAYLATGFFWTALNSDKNTHRVAQNMRLVAADGSETALLKDKWEEVSNEDLTARALPFASSFAQVETV